MAAMNSEGLTFLEWFAATAIPKDQAWRPEMVAKLNKAWREGEDPTEWRHWFETLHIP